MHELLAAAKSGDLIVTNNLSRPVGPGPVEITWTAWEGAPGASKPAATRTATITVRAGSESSDQMEPDQKAEGTVLFTLGDLLYSVPNMIRRLRQ